MTVYIQTPFDNLPQEGCRAMRYWNMAEAFASRGHDVVLFVSSFNHGTKELRRFDDSLKIEIDSPKFKVYRHSPAIKIVVLNTLKYKRNISFRRILSHLVYARSFYATAEKLIAQKTILQPSLVISAVPTLSAALQCRRLALKTNAKILSDIQDAWPEAFYRILPKKIRFLSSLLFLPMRLVAKALYNSSDLVSGVSSSYKHLTGRDDFILARLGISVPPFSQERRASSQRISRLVYAGSLGLGYSLETVIDALKKDLSLTLDIAGEGEKKDSLIRYAEKCGVQDRVRFHGWLGQEAYFSLLSSCDAGVIPMSDESMVALPNKLFDYLNSSIPVIASLHGECERILLEENLGAVYDEKSPESFMKAVERLRKNPPERISLPPTLRADFIYPEFAREVEEALSRKFGQ